MGLLLVVGLLTAGAAVLGTATAPTGPPDRQAFAETVLARATLPPGGRPTRGIRTVQVRWLGGWGATPGIPGVSDAHAFYLYDEPPRTVTRYVATHLPQGAATSGYGTHDGVVTVVTEVIPVSGPDEYMAELTYQVAPTNGAWTKSELRVDAKTVWVPPRSPKERAAAGSLVEVTGFRALSVTTPPGGPVTVVLAGRRAASIIRAFNSLPLGPSSVGCHDDLTYFVLDIDPHEGLPPAFRAVGDACASSVGVSSHGEPRPSLSDRSCVLLEAVAGALPDKARATRSAAAQCARRERRPAGLPPSVAHLGHAAPGGARTMGRDRDRIMETAARAGRGTPRGRRSTR